MYRLSGGVPRVINVIADRALLGAYTQDRHRVAGSLVRARRDRSVRPALRAAMAALGGAAAAGSRARRHCACCSGNSRRGTARPPKPSRAHRRNRRAESQPAKAWTPVSTAASRSAATALIRVASLESGKPARTPLAAARRSTAPKRCRTRRSASSSASGARTTSRAQTIPCTQASGQGLECLVQRGSFGQLRQFNRPAILLLNDEAGNVASGRAHEPRRRAREGRARRRASHEVGIGELSRYWFGDFVMLWRPGTRTREASVRRHARRRTCAGCGQALQRAERRRPPMRRQRCLRCGAEPAGDGVPAAQPARRGWHRRRADPDRARERCRRTGFPAPAHRPAHGGGDPMSFILDALKKSENDRQRQSGPAIFEVRVPPAALEVSAAGDRHRGAAGGESRRGGVAHAAQAAEAAVPRQAPPQPAANPPQPFRQQYPPASAAQGHRRSLSAGAGQPTRQGIRPADPQAGQCTTAGLRWPQQSARQAPVRRDPPPARLRAATPPTAISQVPRAPAAAQRTTTAELLNDPHAAEDLDGPEPRRLRAGAGARRAGRSAARRALAAPTAACPLTKKPPRRITIPPARSGPAQLCAGPVEAFRAREHEAAVRRAVAARRREGGEHHERRGDHVLSTACSSCSTGTGSQSPTPSHSAMYHFRSTCSMHEPVERQPLPAHVVHRAPPFVFERGHQLLHDAHGGHQHLAACPCSSCSC